MTSRERFESWKEGPVDPRNAWAAWQAAEAETARRCAEIAWNLAATDESAERVSESLRAEYPEAFK